MYLAIQIIIKIRFLSKIQLFSNSVTLADNSANLIPSAGNELNLQIIKQLFLLVTSQQDTTVLVSHYHLKLPAYPAVYTARQILCQNQYSNSNN